jgi:hypothetical protein
MTTRPTLAVDNVAPDPLVPSECDLTGLPFMPLDVQRVIDSDLFALATGDEFKAAFALWCKSWSQRPAGSLPNEPRVLARLSGVALADWERMADMALHGWRLCSDGRFYHPVVCEKVLETWTARLAHQKRSAAGNAKRYKHEFDPAPFDEAILRADAMRRSLPSMPSVMHRRRASVAEGGFSPPSGSEDTSLKDRKGSQKSSEVEVEETGTSKEGKEGGGPRKRGARLPEDWAPDAELIAYGVKLGFSHAQVLSISERFRLHWHSSSNRNAVKFHWGKAFQGWLRDDAERKGFGPRPQGARVW